MTLDFDWGAVIVAAVFQIGSFVWGYWMGRRDALAADRDRDRPSRARAPL